MLLMAASNDWYRPAFIVTQIYITSGAVTVFVKYNLTEKGLVKRKLNNMEQCVVLSLDVNC